MRITVVGAGHVGLPIAVLLSQKNDVILYDIDEKRVNAVNSKQIPIINNELERFLSSQCIDLEATTDYKKAYCNAEYVIIAIPTDYNSQNNCFDMASVESAIKQILSVNSETCIIIKSTVPVGYTEEMSNKFNCNILFSPEFLRESYAYYDCFHPTRIIVGVPNDALEQRAYSFAQLLKDSCLKKDTEMLIMTSSDAEAVKLFSNAYLAMRIGFFNELDSYAESSMLNSASIIKGVCLDPRIGVHYNNPSFGYGGYCLPKDIKQLLANYGNVPQCLIKAIIDSNDVRKDFITNRILKFNANIVGIFRLFEINSDNSRNSPIIEILQRINDAGIKTVVYEPTFPEDIYCGSRVTHDLIEFKAISDVIIANRLDNDLADVSDKVYTRDLFGKTTDMIGHALMSDIKFL